MKTIYSQTISILIPTFNSAKTIVDALNSALLQSVNISEILVLDNGSEDETVQIVNEIANHNRSIRLIHCKKKGNKPAALNEGLAKATSSFIGFLDSDDSFHEDFIRILITGFLLYPSASISQTSYANNKFPKKIYDLKYDLVNEKKSVIELYTKGIISVVLWSKLYSKSVFDSFKFDESKVVDDASSTYKLINQNPSIVLNNSILYNYTYHPFSLSNKPKDLNYVYDNIKTIYETHDYFSNTEELKLILPKLINRLFLDLIVLARLESNITEYRLVIYNIKKFINFKKNKLFIFIILSNSPSIIRKTLTSLLFIIFIKIYLNLFMKRAYK